MILYLSSVLEDEYFAKLVKNKKINCGHQAQKFNSLVVRGLAEHTQVFAVSNPPYDLSKGNIESKKCCNDSLTFASISSNNSKLHKFDNFMQMNKIIKSAFKGHKIEAIVCDAINPLASLNAVIFARKHHIPCIAIVTDIPQYMDAGRRSIFTTITENKKGKCVKREYVIPAEGNMAYSYIKQGLFSSKYKIDRQYETVYRYGRLVRDF